ncbi:hypothetical protein NW762_013665 [Fusarium torreyae]|uniref:Uncharacterized protein n=1 Tax=Fusarium torreyae TaxID=1237075 RepID=A0A9W8RPF2_9HYPO|nr:hypothetical protein NW762_013665 [Fusarium torreyae]
MCLETVTFWDCQVCHRELQKERDFKMCKKGRKANEWGSCGQSTVQQNTYSTQICTTCEEAIKNNDKA